MPTFVALLRAVNVGAANRMKMADLRAAFVAAGFDDAVTHIQTGNVVFASTKSAAAIKETVEDLIRTDLGMKITAIIRTAKELAAVAKHHPYGASDLKGLYVSFLDGKPTKDAIAALAAVEFPHERLEVIGREVYIDYGAASAGTSRLSNAIIEKKLGLAATSRNWTVVKNLAELAADHGGS